jgi:hypothetical protein
MRAMLDSGANNEESSWPVRRVANDKITGDDVQHLLRVSVPVFRDCRPRRKMRKSGEAATVFLMKYLQAGPGDTDGFLLDIRRDDNFLGYQCLLGVIWR